MKTFIFILTMIMSVNATAVLRIDNTGMNITLDSDTAWWLVKSPTCVSLVTFHVNTPTELVTVLRMKGHSPLVVPISESKIIPKEDLYILYLAGKLSVYTKTLDECNVMKSLMIGGENYET